MTKVPKLGSVDNVPSHHSGAEGRDFAGRERSGDSGAIAAAAGGWWHRGAPLSAQDWLRTGLTPGFSCPWGAVGGCWSMLARLLGCATAGGGPWRWCACGPPVSVGPGWDSLSVGVGAALCPVFFFPSYRETRRV